MKQTGAYRQQRVTFLCAIVRNMSTDIGSVANVTPSRGQQIVRRVKEQMGGQDIKKQELALRTGIARVTLYRRLSGALPFTVDELELIADALRVDFDWLITGSGTPDGPVPPAGIEPAAFCSGDPLLVTDNDSIIQASPLADVLRFPERSPIDTHTATNRHQTNTGAGQLIKLCP